VPEILSDAADLDLAIFRELYRSGAVSVAGFDPRLNPSRLAERLGVSRARVAARLAEWTRTGLLQRYDVWPNPALFDREGFTLDVRLADRLGKPEVLRRIALVEGAVGGIEMAGEWITVQFVAPDAEHAPRTAELLRGLAGVAEVLPPIPWRRLPPARPLSPLDLRIVRDLRAHPTDALSAVARRVGVSSRTITTRYGQLVEDLSVWFVPILDFRALAPPVVSVSVELEGPPARAELQRAVRRSYPTSIELARPGFGPDLAENLAVFFVLLPSAAAAEELEGFVRRSPGVRSVELLTMVRVHAFPATFDRLLDGASGVFRAGRTSPPEPRYPRRGLKTKGQKG
jgi:DNA-binding Lrp family transcriptional regulator